jgi:hypothetical protein
MSKYLLECSESYQAFKLWLTGATNHSLGGHVCSVQDRTLAFSA